MAEPHGAEDYALLGRYIALFSTMMAEMRSALIWRLQQPGIPPLAIWAIFSGSSARQISDSYFTMARLLVEHDAEGSAVSAQLQARMDREISRRNAFAHGDWWIGVTRPPSGENPDEPPTVEPAAVLRVPARDPDIRPQVASLRERCEAVIRSIAMVRAYSRATFFEPDELTVTDVMHIRDGEIVPGPKLGGWDEPSVEF